MKNIMRITQTSLLIHVKLEQLAKKDGRSLTNLINKILSDYVEDTQK